MGLLNKQQQPRIFLSSLGKKRRGSRWSPVPGDWQPRLDHPPPACGECASASLRTSWSGGCGGTRARGHLPSLRASERGNRTHGIHFGRKQSYFHVTAWGIVLYGAYFNWVSLCVEVFLLFRPLFLIIPRIYFFRACLRCISCTSWHDIMLNTDMSTRRK